jgi:putative flavoprotein involved in K+ transport
LQHVAKQGVKIVGRLVDVSNGVLIFEDSARENVQFADTFSVRFKTMVDDYLEGEGIEPPPVEPDPADEPDPEATCVSDIERLDLAAAGVKTIIWTTGFTATFDWLKLPVLDGDGMPIHQRGVAPVGGLYFLGFPWLHSRKSGVIYGIDEDACYVVDQIKERSV